MERSCIYAIRQEQKFQHSFRSHTYKITPELKKFLCSLIAPIINEGDCYDAWKFVASHFVNGISRV